MGIGCRANRQPRLVGDQIDFTGFEGIARRRRINLRARAAFVRETGASRKFHSPRRRRPA